MQHLKIRASGASFHVARAGAGPALLLLHGWPEFWLTWEPVMARLADRFTLFAPDLRGFGDSDKPDGVDGYDSRALAEEFRVLVREIAFGAGRPPILAAHDMGAPPALLWAADHPDEVAGLLYIEGPVMLSAHLQKIIAYTPEAMENGSMWWWILPLAPAFPNA